MVMSTNPGRAQVNTLLKAITRSRLASALGDSLNSPGTPGTAATADTTVSADSSWATVVAPAKAIASPAVSIIRVSADQPLYKCKACQVREANSIARPPLTQRSTASLVHSSTHLAVSTPTSSPHLPTSTSRSATPHNRLGLDVGIVAGIAAVILLLAAILLLLQRWRLELKRAREGDPKTDRPQYVDDKGEMDAGPESLAAQELAGTGREMDAGLGSLVPQELAGRETVEPQELSPVSYSSDGP